MAALHLELEALFAARSLERPFQAAQHKAAVLVTMGIIIVIFYRAFGIRIPFDAKSISLGIRSNLSTAAVSRFPQVDTDAALDQFAAVHAIDKPRVLQIRAFSRDLTEDATAFARRGLRR